MSQKIGYARVSSTGQNLDAQIDLLEKAGCVRVFREKISGTRTDRPEWEALTSYIRSGDTLMITELSRMSRSLAHLLELVKLFKERGVELKSLRENIDTATATGRAFLSIMGAVAQMEIEIKSERAAAGREAAKARGKSGGRPALPRDKLEQARILYENSDRSAAQICETFGFSRRSFFDYLRKRKEKEPPAGE